MGLVLIIEELAILNQVAVPLTPLPGQHEIVRRVDRLFALARQEGRDYEPAAALLERIGVQ